MILTPSGDLHTLMLWMIYAEPLEACTFLANHLQLPILPWCMEDLKEPPDRLLLDPGNPWVSTSAIDWSPRTVTNTLWSVNTKQVLTAHHVILSSALLQK